MDEKRMTEEELKRRKFWTYLFAVAAVVLFLLSFPAGTLWGPEKVVPFRALGGVSLIIFFCGLPKLRQPKQKPEEF